MSGQEPDNDSTSQQPTPDELAFPDLKPGEAWGESITKQRAAELDAILQQWEKGHGERKGPFDGIVLTGADVRWLAQRVRTSWGVVPDLHLEGAKLFRTHLEGAALGFAHLEGASLFAAHLEGARLDNAHLEAANLGSAYLQGANFQGVFLDRVAYLNRITLGDDRYGSLQLADVRWGEVNLAIVDWTRQKRGLFGLRGSGIEAIELGDERLARTAKGSDGRRKNRATRLQEYQDAVRANRQLATALRQQGLNEDADRFAYKAQKLQRHVLRRRRRYGAAFGSWLLDVIAGYGYKPLRSLITYVLVVGAFALTYYLLGGNVHPPLDPLGAVVFSITSFHGRGFAPGENVAITNPVTVLAACEAIIGLLIEITFIATFTQRFFAR